MPIQRLRQQLTWIVLLWKLAIASYVEFYSYEDYTGYIKLCNIGSRVIADYRSFRLYGDVAVRINDPSTSIFQTARYSDITTNTTNLGRVYRTSTIFVIPLKDVDSPPPGSIWYYSEPNYNGIRTKYDDGVENSHVEIQTGSIQLGLDMILVQYQKPNFTGFPTLVNNDTNALDGMKSFRVLSRRNTMQHPYPNVIKVYDEANYKGRLTNVFLNASLSIGKDMDVRFGSIQIPTGLAILMTNPNDITTYWSEDIPNFQAIPVKNFWSLTAVLSTWEFPTVISIPSIEIHFDIDIKYIKNIPILKLPLNSFKYKNYFELEIKSISIPKKLAFIGYDKENWDGNYRIWTNTSKTDINFKIISYNITLEGNIKDWIQHEPEPNHVYVYGGKNYTNEHLIVPLNQDIPYFSFLYPHFGNSNRIIGSISIPNGLVVLAYSLSYYGGIVQVFNSSIDSLNFRVQSLRVRNSKEYIHPTQVPTQEMVEIFARDSPVYIPVGSNVMMFEIIDDIRYSTMLIPNGWQVVGYTKPYFLGLKDVWRSTGEPTALTLDRIQSLKVIPIDSTPKLSNRSVARFSSVWGYKYFGIGYFEKIRHFSHETDPCVSFLRGDQGIFRSRYAAKLSEATLVWYEECFYQGIMHVETKLSPERDFLRELKSYKILEYGADVMSESDYVGLYCLWHKKDEQALYLRMNEQLPQLYHPWNTSVNYLRISPGLVVMGYDGPNYTGNCKWWTAKNTSNAQGKIPIDFLNWGMQSIKTESELEWQGPASCTAVPATAAPSISTPTTSPWIPFIGKNDTNNENDNAAKDKTDATTTPEGSVNQSTNLPTEGSIDAGEDGIPSNESVNNRTTTSSQIPNDATKKVDGLTTSGATTTIPEPLNNPSNQSNSRTSFNIFLTLGIIAIGLFVIFVIYDQRRNRTKSSTNQLPGLNTFHFRDLDIVQLDFKDIILQRQIATGSTGIILLATFREKPVTIKMLYPNDLHHIQPFIDEIDVWSKLESPYLVALLGAAWTQPSDLMAVMEYMNMGDLRTHLSNSTPITFAWHDKLTCLYNTAQGLFYLHSLQLLHRDLKSRNVLLDTEKGTKLCDFGSSKDDAFGATMTAMVGTFRWMAPEMLLFQKYSYPVDIFSFAAVMCEMVTHEVPYSGMQNSDGRLMSDEQVVRQVLHEGLRPSLPSSCPAWYRKLALRCMSREQTDRPSISELISTFHQKISDPVTISSSTFKITTDNY